MKVLHLAGWYPSPGSPLNGIFIKDYIDNLQGRIFQKVVHIHAEQGDGMAQIERHAISDTESSFLLRSRFCHGRLEEWLTVLLLVLTRLSLGRKWWDIVNVHIAIPLACHPRLLRALFGHRIIITEHWSAYHYNFYLPEHSNARHRLQRVFHHGIPVITVSSALADDIRRFSGSNAFPSFVVPNIIQPNVFRYRSRPAERDRPVTFLMAASWSQIKQPFLVLEAFLRLHGIRKDLALRIVGEGQQWNSMKDFVKDRGLEGSVTFLGRLNKNEMAREMQNADCFLHASKYETFSIVCVESLFCGTPVIASSIAAIRDYLDAENGLFSENTVDDWYETLTSFLQIRDRFDREGISRRAIERFHPDRVRELVLEAYRWTLEHQDEGAR